jgi:hypothetical protein
MAYYSCHLPQVGVFTKLLTGATYTKFVGGRSVGENTDSGQEGRERRAESLERRALSREIGEERTKKK